MRTVSLTNNQNEASSMSARLTLPNEAPQNPQLEVVSDGSSVSQLCQRNSSISHFQDHKSVTRMSITNSERNLAQGSGQFRAPSYLTQGEESYGVRSANRTTDEPIYRERIAPMYRQDSSTEGSAGETIYRDKVSKQNNSTRDHTYNVRYQSDYESVHQRDHVLPTPVDESNSTSVATDRTICRD